jgi:hypothetical protein
MRFGRKHQQPVLLVVVKQAQWGLWVGLWTGKTVATGRLDSLDQEDLSALQGLLARTERTVNGGSLALRVLLVLVASFIMIML